MYVIEKSTTHVTKFLLTQILSNFICSFKNSFIILVIFLNLSKNKTIYL